MNSVEKALRAHKSIAICPPGTDFRGSWNCAHWTARKRTALARHGCCRHKVVFRAQASPGTSVRAQTGVEDSGKAKGVKSQAPTSREGSAGISLIQHNDGLEVPWRAQIKITPGDRRDGLQKTKPINSMILVSMESKLYHSELSHTSEHRVTQNHIWLWVLTNVSISPCTVNPTCIALATVHLIWSSQVKNQATPLHHYFWAVYGNWKYKQIYFYL